MTRPAILFASLLVLGCNGNDDDTGTPADTDPPTEAAGCDSCESGEVCVEYTEGGEQVDFSCEPLDGACSDISDVCGSSGDACYDVYAAFCDADDGVLCFTVSNSATLTCSGS